MDLNLEGTANDDTIDGGDGNDSIFGGDGNDTLIGFSGDDSIDGGDGNDTLIGFSGKDTLIGGDGSDVFVFDPQDMSGIDTVVDFVVGEDTLEIRPIIPPSGGIPDGGIPDGGIPDGGIPGGGIPDGGIPGGGIPGGGIPDGGIPGEYDPHTGLLSVNGNPIAQLPVGLDLNLQSDSNIAPIAQDDSFTTDENTSISFNASHLLSNDSDPDGDTLAIDSIDDSNTQGTVFFDNESQTLTYDPNGQFNTFNNGEDATDSFSYTISDGNGGTATGTVAINITGVSDGGNNNDGDDNLFGTDEADFLDGGNGNDILNGNKGNDTLLGGEGHNILYGFNGDDVLETGGGSDNLQGGNGNDNLTAGGGNDTITGGDGNDIIDGGDGNDTIDGGSQDDAILGGSGDDLINGGNGDDTIGGGAGHDVLVGDGGSDVFVVNALGGTDTIRDFNFDNDKIGLSDGITFDQITISQGNGAAIIDFHGQSIASISGGSPNQFDASKFIEV